MMKLFNDEFVTKVKRDQEAKRVTCTIFYDIVVF